LGHDICELSIKYLYLYEIKISLSYRNAIKIFSITHYFIVLVTFIGGGEYLNLAYAV